MNQEPQDPFSSMQEAAAGQHELYLNWVNAGFTPEQALELVKGFVAEIIRAGIDGC